MLTFRRASRSQTTRPLILRRLLVYTTPNCLSYPYLDVGFDPPDPVSADLLLPFQDFVKKYNLDGMTYTVFNYGQGFGDILSQLTIYVMKNFRSAVLQSIGSGFIVPTFSNSHELYDKTQNELKIRYYVEFPCDMHQSRWTRPCYSACAYTSRREARYRRPPAPDCSTKVSEPRWVRSLAYRAISVRAIQQLCLLHWLDF